MSKAIIDPLPEPTEPQGPLYFTNLYHCKDHYQRHVLDDPQGENWAEISPFIKNDENKGPLIYQDLINNAALQVCTSKTNHVHTILRKLEEIEGVTHYKMAEEIIYGWNTSKRIYFILVKNVRFQHYDKYYILTGYRSERLCTDKNFNRRMIKKTMDKSIPRFQHILAKHYEYYE